jgi:hypothetical protein
MATADKIEIFKLKDVLNSEERLKQRENAVSTADFNRCQTFLTGYSERKTEKDTWHLLRGEA